MLPGRRLATVFVGVLILYFVLYSPSTRLRRTYTGSEFIPSVLEPQAGTSQNLSSSPSESPGNDPIHQPDYQSDQRSFRNRQDWYFDADPSKVFSPLGPKPENIILLTAGDGGGNNAEIPDLLESVSQNRQEYCDYQGYTCVFTNITKYDIEGYHAVWAKIPSIAQAFSEHPNAEWVWWLDLDAIIMSPTFDFRTQLLSHAAIAQNILNDTAVRLSDDATNRPHIKTHPSPRIPDIDVIIGQDQNGFNAGSFLLRRSFFTRFLLEIWVDPLFLTRDTPGREQDAILDLYLQHPIVREHTGLVEMHWFNAYSVGGPEMGWRDGTVAVHFAGCWVEHRCTDIFKEFWGKRVLVKDLPGGEEKLRKALERRGGRGPVYT
ncbi:MAG: hypothetical protein M1839_003693 [Geoglossum umbratile]|nr:MAG: hypothetical protein M1839_003693 [Geoglossum umbratile]